MQQHLNRSLKRYARLTGNVQPSKRALQDKLQKRMAATEPLIGRANRKRSQAERRHKHKSQEENAGYDKDAASSSSAAASSADDGDETATGATGNSTDTSSTGDDTGKSSKKGKSKGKDKKGGDANSGASNSTATGVASGNSTDTGASESAGSNSTDAGAATSTGTAASASGSSSTAEGFPEIDLEAQTNGGLTAANAPTASDSLGLDIEANDVGYIATVQVGTPPQDFKFLMDTGSADMWVGSEDCTTQGTTQGCVRTPATTLSCAVC